MPFTATLIAQLNNARVGSFGEHLFEHSLREAGRRVERMHSNSTDFVVDGAMVDVKTTRTSLQKNATPFRRYAGRRVPGIVYAQVEFFQSSVRISLDTTILFELAWSDVETAFARWRTGHTITTAVSPLRTLNSDLWKPLSQEIEAFFDTRGLKARCGYRTTQARFGSESPDNLKPRAPKPQRVTVFVFFAGTVDKSAIEFVVAFHDRESDQLPMLPAHRQHLHLPKVDLGALHARFRFSDLDDLYRRFDSDI